jgi:hypothetical protein
MSGRRGDLVYSKGISLKVVWVDLTKVEAALKI